MQLDPPTLRFYSTDDCGRSRLRHLGLLIGLSLALHAAPVVADGISLQHIKLSELVDRSQVALQVKVTVPNDPEGFKARVTRVWRPGDPPAWSVGVEYTFVWPQEPPPRRASGSS